MTTATDTDLQQVKDLITTLHTATQKQINDGNAAIQKQITDGNAAMQKQIAELTLEMKVGFTKLEGDIKNLDTKFDEKTKSLDQRITGKDFTIRGVTVAILGGLLLAFGKFLFFGKI